MSQDTHPDLSPAEHAAGLTRPLPPAEHIVWQVAPSARALIAAAFHPRGIAIGFALAGLAVALGAHSNGRPWGQAVAEAVLAVPPALVVLALIAIAGRMGARATTYTLTNRRLILHVGVAWEMTVSIPLSNIRGAALRARRDGTGDIALTVKDAGDIGRIALWPHVRLGSRDIQPLLRALPDAESAAEAIGDALVAFNATGRARQAVEPVSAYDAPREAVAA